jgi:ActR/RegA family two-component response regulator
MKGKRVLFVDDEPNLRLTFPQILKMRGFEVRTAATVAQALAEITTHPFEILISDLNVGEAGDGFTVVSAMRRTQPECVNFILTGFPAFESALAAIQKQVDGYLVKPARVEELVQLIQDRLDNRPPRPDTAMTRLSGLLRESVDEIRSQVLSRMKAHPALGPIEMSDQERVDYVSTVVIEVAKQLSGEQNAATERSIEASRKHGRQRFSAGYEVSMLVADSAILEGVVFDMVREHLLMLDTSNLVLDLKRFNDAIQLHVECSVQAYSDQVKCTSV